MVNHTTLIATLGGQPQVVTFILDRLLARGEIVDQVFVIYFAGNPRYEQAYQRLAVEFVDGSYQGRTCRLRAVAVKRGPNLLADAREPAEVEAVRRTIQNLLAELKEQDQTLHLAVSGGRRIMAMVALTTAMRYMTPADRIWHLYTPEGLQNEARGGAVMHAPQSSSIQLIEVPFVPWAAYFPGLEPLLDQPPQSLDAKRLGWLSDEDRRRCQEVWDLLTSRRREVLKALAQGKQRQEIASILQIVPATVDDHREAIMATCEKVWGKDGIPFERQALLNTFGPFVNSQDLY